MAFLKEDLVGQHYSWGNHTTSAFTGQPSRRLFDRFNGNQVLFIINSYGSQSEKFTVNEAHIIEELINKYLPVEAKSEMSVFNWIKEACSLQGIS